MGRPLHADPGHQQICGHRRGRRLQRPALVLGALAAAAVTATVLAGPATAATATPAPGGELAGWGACPVDNPAFDDSSYKNPDAVSYVSCLHSETKSGSFTAGKVTVPLTHPIILDTSYAQVTEPGVAPYQEASPPQWLHAQAEQIPGGLLGLAFGIQGTENFLPGITDVKATVEQAGQPSGVNINNLTIGSTLPRLPVKVHLQNLLLGPHCYIGSDTNPIVLRPAAYLIGQTNPPPPNQPIKGDYGDAVGGELGAKTGDLTFIHTVGTELVDNAFAVPAAQGCGPFGLGLIDGFVNFSAGLPSVAGHNTVKLSDTDAWVLTANPTETLRPAENLRHAFTESSGQPAKPLPTGSK